MTRLPLSIYVAILMTDSSARFADERFYASMFVAFLYTCMNPFIYATKFDPVRQILKGMIPCKKISVQPTEEPGINTTRKRPQMT